MMELFIKLKPFLNLCYSKNMLTTMVDLILIFFYSIPLCCAKMIALLIVQLYYKLGFTEYDRYLRFYLVI